MPGRRRRWRALLLIVGVVAGTTIAAAPAQANFHLMKIREVYPGTGANDSYVELQMVAGGQNLVLNHQISVWNASGTSHQTFLMDDDVDDGDNNATIVIGEGNSPGGRDFQKNLSLSAAAGAFCFDDASPVDCVSWGAFTGNALLPDNAGLPASSSGVTPGKAIQRSIAAGCSHLLEPGDDTDNSAADFSEVTPNPRPNGTPIVESDCVPPDTIIGDRPPAVSNSTSAAFTFSSTPVGATFQCKLDANAPEACNSGSKAYPGPLSQGSHTFTVTASNADGPDPTPATYMWNVDSIPPDTTITGGPADASTTNDNDPSFGFSGTVGDVDHFECKRDAEPAFATCTSPKAYTDLADSSHTFSVRACDAAGNCDQTPATRTWTIDTAAPNAVITSGPADGSTTNDNDPSFGFEGSPPGDVHHFECKRDAEVSYVTCTSPKAYTDLADTAHTFSVRACDAVGNCDPTPATRSWTIDTAAPNTSIVIKPTDPSPDNSPSFTYSSTEANSTFKCKLDAEPTFTSCPAAGKDYAGPLSDAQHTFSVKATDPVGNEDQTAATYTWTINTALPPDTVIDTTPDSTPPFLTNSATADFTFHGEGNISSLQCKLDAEPAFTTCTTPKQYTGLTDGEHTFSVRAVGPGGTDSTPASYTWTIDLTAPNTTLGTTPSNPSSSTSASFTYSSTEANSTFKCKLDAEPAFSDCPAGGKDYAGPLSAGAHTFSVFATDPAGNADPTPATFPWTIQLVSVPDTTITKAPKPKGTDTTPKITFTATPPAGATFQCRVDTKPFAACTSPHTTKRLKLGKHTFDVFAQNGAGPDPSPAHASFKIIKK